MASIFEFDDYRDYLSKKFNSEKEDTNGKKSLAFVAKKIGISKSYLNFVLSKKRHLSVKNALPTAKYFGLSNVESRFLIFNIIQSTLPHSEIRKFFHGILDSLKTQHNLESIPEKITFGVPDDESRCLYDGSLRSIVHSLHRCGLEYSDVKSFEKSIFGKWYTQKELKKYLQDLSSSKVEAKDKNSWHVQWSAADQSPPIREICDSMLNFSRVLKNPHDFNPKFAHSMTLSFSEETLIKARELIEETSRKILDLSANSQDPKSVVHCLFLFANIATVDNDLN